MIRIRWFEFPLMRDATDQAAPDSAFHAWRRHSESVHAMKSDRRVCISSMGRTMPPILTLRIARHTGEFMD
jgi:hypothetical protein